VLEAVERGELTALSHLRAALATLEALEGRGEPPGNRAGSTSDHRVRRSTLARAGVTTPAISVATRVAPAVLDRFKSGPAATVTGALLLILGGVVEVAHGGVAGPAIAFVGCVVVVRERLRHRKGDPLE
jgi:hypothetical protein